MHPGDERHGRSCITRTHFHPPLLSLDSIANNRKAQHLRIKVRRHLLIGYRNRDNREARDVHNRAFLSLRLDWVDPVLSVPKEPTTVLYKFDTIGSKPLIAAGWGILEDVMGRLRRRGTRGRRTRAEQRPPGWLLPWP